MAAVIIVEDGVGRIDANSYTTIAQSDAYFETSLQDANWTAASTDRKNRLLISATRVIDATFDFLGFKSNPLQALQWPRVLARDKNTYGGAYFRTPDSYLQQYFDASKVPQLIRDATCEMARFLAVPNDDRLGDAQGIGISSFEIFQGVKVQFDQKNLRPIVPDSIGNILMALGTMRNSGGSANSPLQRV